LGKTSLAHVIAYEMSANIKTSSGPVLNKVSDLAAILTNLKESDVLFIDEIHRLNKIVEESLYSAMEDFKLDIIIGDGPTARMIKIDLPKFTLVGATTRLGLLSKPFKDRFGILVSLEPYSLEDITTIIMKYSLKFGTEINDAAAAEIARRSRGTPRIALRLLRRVRDFCSPRLRPKLWRRCEHADRT
jgi:Holliday junction DNA helicase RuvB